MTLTEVEVQLFSWYEWLGCYPYILCDHYVHWLTSHLVCATVGLLSSVVSHTAEILHA